LTPPARRREPGSCEEDPEEQSGPARRYHASHRVIPHALLTPVALMGAAYGASGRHDVAAWRPRGKIDKQVGRRPAAISSRSLIAGPIRDRHRATPIDSITVSDRDVRENARRAAVLRGSGSLGVNLLRRAERGILCVLVRQLRLAWLMLAGRCGAACLSASWLVRVKLPALRRGARCRRSPRPVRAATTRH
jgi:hypothetical protein